MSWSEISPPIVAIFIGLVAASIAYRQYRVAKAKLSLDLFDRRYAIFDQAWEMLSTVAIDGVDNAKFFSTFTNNIPQAAFLFGDDIAEYLENISTNRTALIAIVRRAERNNNVLLPGDIDKHTQLSIWFVEEANGGARKKFAKFLDFKEWR